VNEQDNTPHRDPVREVREHLEHALAALERMREQLPPASNPPDSERGA
jgi:hypothetical protein